MQVKHTVDAGDPTCLHCVLNYAIASWGKAHAPRDDEGRPVVDISLVIANLTEVTAEHVYLAPDLATRRRFEAFARKCLKAAFVHQRTGEIVGVSVDEVGDA